MKKLDVVMMILLILGGLNWGLVGLFDFNVVDYIFGETWVDRVIYVLVGIAAVYEAFGWKGISKRTKGKR